MLKINKLLIIGAFLVSFLSADSAQLSSGFYHSTLNKDSIVVEARSEKINLELSNGSKLSFENDGGKYKMMNLSGDGYTALKILSDNKFQIYYDYQESTGSSVNTYELYKKPGILNKIIAFLVTSELFISIFQFYLKLNKVWKRRGIKEVASSISIVAALLGFAVGFPFLLNSLFINSFSTLFDIIFTISLLSGNAA